MLLHIIKNKYTLLLIIIIIILSIYIADKESNKENI